MRRYLPATSALSPIIVDTTCAAGITVAAATGLAQHLFAKRATLGKRFTEVNRSDSPHHASAHCGVCAPAARRSARAIVSVPFSGLLLSYPIRVKGLVGRYPANSLIRRSLIAERKCSNSHSFSGKKPSSSLTLYGISLSFPRVFPSLR